MVTACYTLRRPDRNAPLRQGLHGVTVHAMEAINKLRSTGLSTAQIAEGAGCTAHAIRLYERGLRFPDKEKFKALTAFAASRGVELTATDFISRSPEKGEAA